MNIYIIGTENGPKKIGYSRSPKQRLAAIQSANPLPVTLLHHRHIGDFVSVIEARVHRRLRNHRLNGEWFDVSLEEAIAAVEAAIADPISPQSSIESTPAHEAHISSPLAEWIKDEGISRSEAAERLGLAKGYLTELCQRKKEPSLSVALRIISASADRITITDLAIPRGIQSTNGADNEQSG